MSDIEIPEYALTLWSPWSQCILYGGKLVENRTYRPPEHLMGKRLAIHTGQTSDDKAYRYLREDPSIYSPSRSRRKKGCLVGSVVIAGYRTPDSLKLVKRFADLVTLSQRDKWFSGPIGWILYDPIPFVDAIPSRGWPGVWGIEDHVRAQLRY